MQLLGYLQKGNGSTTPNTQQSAVITPNILKPTTPINLPTQSNPSGLPVTQQQTQQPQPTVTPEVVPSYADTQLTNLATQKTDNQKFQESSIYDILKGTQDLAGESAMLQQQQDLVGVQAKEAEYRRISDQIRTRQAQTAQERAQINKSPMSFAARSGYEAAVQATNDSEVGALNAQAQAVAGEYDMAVQTAQKAVDAKYKPIKEKLEIQKLQLEAIKPLLDADQKKQAAEMDRAIKLEERNYDKLIADEKIIQNLSLEAAKNGASSGIISKIASAKSFEEAIRIGGGYMADPLDRSIKAAQLRKLNQDFTKSNREMEDAVVNSVVNEKDPTKLISNFFKTNPKIKTNQDINNAAGVVSAINNFSGTVGGGKIKGYGFLGGGFLPEAFKSQKGIQNKAQISSIEGKVQQWLSGAALSKAQEKLVNKMIPERNDNDATVRTKLNSLTNYMLGDIKGRATAQGAQFEYIPVDLFSKPDTSVQPDTKTSVVSAISAGYEPTEVIDFVSQNYPEQATKIQQARQAGYTDQEIIEYLSL